MDFGDTPYSMEEPLLTHKEAVDITGVPSKTLNNWTQRGIIELGEMHRTGRRLYSMHDLIQLKIVYELVELVQMSVSYAAAAAKWARERSFEMSVRDATGKLKYKGSKNEERQYLTIFFKDGKHRIEMQKGAEWITNYSIAYPIIILPLDDIILKVLNMCFDALDPDLKIESPNPAPKTSEDYKADFQESMMMLDVDENGNKIFVGLTFAETQEFEAYLNMDKKGDDYNRKSIEQMNVERDRYLDLNNKHEIARLKRLDDTFADRLKEHLNRKD